MTAYRVTAPYVTAPSVTQSAANALLYPLLVGWLPPALVKPYTIDPICGFGVGAILPADVPAATITMLLGKGLITVAP